MNAPALFTAQAADRSPLHPGEGLGVRDGLPIQPTCTNWQTGLLRYPVGEQQAQAAATVDHLHAWSDYFDPAGQRDTFSLHDRPMLTDLLRTAAVLLDEYRAGSALEHPHPRSGWVLVPATLAPKVRAAVEGLIFALEEDAEDIGADIAGGRAVLRLLADPVGCGANRTDPAHADAVRSSPHPTEAPL